MASISATALGEATHGYRDRGEKLLAGSAALIAVALCVPTVGSLRYLWQDVAYYGHAYALPFTAAYLVYCSRKEILTALRRFQPPRVGPLIVFLAATIEVVAFMGDVMFVAGLGVPLVLGSAAFAIGGMPLLRPLTLPLVFLGLMIPPPQFLVYELLFRLKLIVTHTAVSLLQAGGMTLLAEGNQILLPGHTLFVADACSGLTSIVTMLPLAVIVAYFLSKGIWRRGAIIASVLPLAIAANVARVALTVCLVSVLGAGAAQGLLHQSFGIATYLVGTLTLVGVARLLR